MVSKKTTKKSTKKKVQKKTRKSSSSGVKKVAKRRVSKRVNSKNSSAKNENSSSPAKWFWKLVRFWSLRIGLIILIPVMAYTAYLDISIRKQFEGQKWALPAHVYTRPLELYLGQRFDQALVQAELDELGYVDRANLDRVGSFRASDNELAIHQREFRFWDRLRPQQIIRLKLDQGRIQGITVQSPAGEIRDTEIVRLEPRLFGSVSPLSHEDRKLLKLEDVPPLLVAGLIANEDRHFYQHFGINPIGIARAMVKNIRAGRVVQGGSTLTQQLVKNYYLSSERSFRRKFIEMIMAILLELHYDKDQILQAYLNEVFLGQAGNRAIHGFGLASQYFYGRPLDELELHQLASLVAINNGPSRYNPVKHPKRALERRNLVLTTMRSEGHIQTDEYQAAIAAKLNVSPVAARAATLSYPSFMGFVRDNLNADYQQDDLLHDGLQIHTTLNPRIQQSLERAVRSEIGAIEQRKNLAIDSLQVAAVVLRTDNGEVAAMLGDRNPGFSGYNRALRASRPVGSLLKPFVYLTALEKPLEYSLATLVDDKPITVTQKGSPPWQPQNYDGLPHGQIMLIDALARSYNLATVNLGMELGVSEVADTIRRVGYPGKVKEFPSLLLGALPMSVMDVGQLYLTLASGGFKMPIKGIRSVLTNQDEPLARYSLDIEQVIESEFTTLINYALQDVVRNGTARNVLTGFDYDYGLAGKTGTTDEYRDSWFAGFSGNYLTVVWIGRDDNKPTNLTGASGAAKIWAKAMQNMSLERLELNYTDDLLKQDIYFSEDPVLNDCGLSRRLPMLIDSLSIENIPCFDLLQYDLDHDDELEHFEPLPEPKPKRLKKKPWWSRIFG